MIVVLDDGGVVVIVSIVDAAAPLERLRGEPGLKEQLAPAIGKKLHDSATVLDTLLDGVAVKILVPVCPEIILRPDEAVESVKSGMATLTKRTGEKDVAKFESPE